jgi:hypothetical protein
MDWSDDEPPYPSALTRPVPPPPGTAWGMVAVIAWAALKDTLSGIRYWLTTTREERAASRYRRVLGAPISPETRERARQEPVLGWADEVARFSSGDHLAPWGDPLPTRPRRFWREFLTPPPEDDSFI